MEDHKKNKNLPKAYFPHNRFTTSNDVSYHFTPYGGSSTFKAMKQKAEQALTDHEFKA